jgi:hypothetical protein
MEPSHCGRGIVLEPRAAACGDPTASRAGEAAMNIAVPSEDTDLSPYLPDERGLFFIHHFTADGLRTKDPAETLWTWRSYQITDMRARHEIAAEQALPAAVREALLSPSHGCHIDYEDDWLYGDLPDLRHDFAEARGLTHFRFAFNDKILIGARKQPLESVDKHRGPDRVRRLAQRAAGAGRRPPAVGGYPPADGHAHQPLPPSRSCASRRPA